MEINSQQPRALLDGAAPLSRVPPEPTAPTRSTSRERVFRALELRDSATIVELAAATGLHENTVREHLARLHTEGRIRSRPAPAAGRGRPAQLWSVIDLTTASAYAGLAAALAAALSHSPNAQQLAYEAGRDWGQRVAAGSVDTADDRGGRGLVIDVMRAQGFDPAIIDAVPTDRLPHSGPEEAGTSESVCSISLRRCPLRAAASAHPQVVCAVHAGLVEGLASSRTPIYTAALTPFASPEQCLLQIRPV